MIKSLSILIPVHNQNCCRLLAALTSQCNRQADLVWEIIVLDDASTDAASIAENRVATQRPGVTLLENAQNEGRSRARNRLAQSAHNEWLLFLDSDVQIIDPLFVVKYLRCDQTEVTCGGCIVPNISSSHQRNLRYLYEAKCQSRLYATHRKRNPYKSFRTINYLIRRTTMLDNLFPEDHRSYGYEDVLLGRRLCRKNVSICHIDNYVMIGDFEPNDAFLEKTREALRTLHAYEPFLIKYNGVASLISRLRRVHLAGLLSFAFRLLRPALERNLLGTHPRVFLYNVYRTGYYSTLS